MLLHAENEYICPDSEHIWERNEIDMNIFHESAVYDLTNIEPVTKYFWASIFLFHKTRKNNAMY